DGSSHVISYDQADAIMKRLKAKACIPHHYFVRGLMRVGSTLLPATDWVRRHQSHTMLDSARLAPSPRDLEGRSGHVFYFGDHLAFPVPGGKAQFAEGVVL